MKKQTLALLLALALSASWLSAAAAGPMDAENVVTAEPVPVTAQTPALSDASQPAQLLADAQTDAPAAEAAVFSVTGGTEGTDWRISEGNVLEILTGTPLTVSGGSTDTDNTGATTFNKVQGRIWIKKGITANLTLDTLYLAAPEYLPAVRVEKTSTLNLSTGADAPDGTAAAILTGGKYRAGIEVPATATLRITGESDGHTLNVTAGEYSAAIGGSKDKSSQYGYDYADGVGTIEIEGGTVVTNVVNQVYDGAGIGAAYTTNQPMGDITISGGIVRAVGNPAIGAHDYNSGSYGTSEGSITITGGNVTASGKGTSCDAICAPGADITITGGTVTAQTGNGYCIGDEGAGGSTITISGSANVTAKKSGLGTAIGIEKNGTVNITGGTVVVSSGDRCIGIGGGCSAGRTAVNISNATVTSNAGPGIGGDFCDVTISSGTVTATGQGAPGIGGEVNMSGDDYLYHGTVTITGGDVTAIGGQNLSNYGAGIGTAGGAAKPVSFATEAKITITGGTVLAAGHGLAQGIGGGWHSSNTEDKIGGGSDWFYTAGPDGTPGNALIFATSIGDDFAQHTDRHRGLFFPAVTYDFKGDVVSAYGAGTVLGDVTLDRSLYLPKNGTLAIPQGSSLTLAEGCTLTTGKTDGNIRFGVDVTNNGVFTCRGALDVSQGGSFVNAATGVFDWYGTVTGTLDRDAEGNIVNYPSQVTLSAPADSTFGDQVTFTATVERVPKDSARVITEAAGTVDFYLDGAQTPFASQSAALAEDGSGVLTASADLLAAGADWKAGEHTVTAKYQGGRGVTGQIRAQQLPGETDPGAAVNVGKRPLTDAMVSSTFEPYTYDGTAKVPQVTVDDQVDGQSIITPADYTVTFSDNVSAGTATLRVAAAESGNYSGEIVRLYSIVKAEAPEAQDLTVKAILGQAETYTVDLTEALGQLPEGQEYGAMTYTVVATADDGAVLAAQPTVADGMLSLNVKAVNGAPTPDAVTVTLTAQSVNFTDVTVTVKVDLDDPYTLGAMALTDADGQALDAIPQSGSFQVTVPVTENAQTGGANVLLAAYDDNGRLLRLFTAPVGAEDTLSFTLDADGVQNVKAFALSARDDLAPLAAPVQFSR